MPEPNTVEALLKLAEEGMRSCFAKLAEQERLLREVRNAYQKEHAALISSISALSAAHQAKHSYQLNLRGRLQRLERLVDDLRAQGRTDEDLPGQAEGQGEASTTL